MRKLLTCISLLPSVRVVRFVVDTAISYNPVCEEVVDLDIATA